MSDDHLVMCCCCRAAHQYITEEKDAEIELLRGYRDAAEADAAVAHLLLDKMSKPVAYAAPPTWQEDVAAVEEAFERSGVQPTWPADEAGNIGPMAAAMADEIERLRLTDEQREAINLATDFLKDEFYGCSDSKGHNAAVTLRNLLERLQ